MPSLEEEFEQAFTEIQIPGTGKHLLEADSIKNCVVSGQSVTITLDLGGDGEMKKTVSQQIQDRITQIHGIDIVHINHEGEAPHTPPAPEGSQPRPSQGPQRPERQVYLQNYGAVIAVSSGKGGVGKSTVATNLAVTLANMGHKVSLFDADIYGPSIPIMMGLRSTRPKMEEDNSIQTLEKYGIDMMSIGFLVEEAAATVWRGPIVHQVIDQMLRDTKWPGGDFMIIDMPPGTGDAQLTLSQVLEITGAVVVSTPQDVALLDAIKGVQMFEKVEVPILGLVENMSTFVCPNCQHETHIFDTGNAEKAASQNSIPFLGRIPIEPAIREGGDMGAPIVSKKDDSNSSKAFTAIAEALIAQLDKL